MEPTTIDKRLEVPDAPEFSLTASATDRISLLDLLIVLGQKKEFLGWSTLVVAVMTAIISLVLPQWFTASTTILPPQQNSSMSAALMSQLSGLGSMGTLIGGNLGLKNPADLSISLLKSRTVEDALVQRFDLMKRYNAKKLSDARKKLETHTTLESGVKDGLVRISVEDHDAATAAEMANAYVEEYKKLAASMVVTEAGERRAFFEKEAKVAMDDLANAEQALKQTQESTGMFAMEPQSKAMIESLTALRARIDAQEVLVRSLRSFATDQNRDLVLAEQQLATMREQLARAERGSGNGSIADLPIEKVPSAGLEYLRKLREVKYREALFELLAKQFEAAKLDEARQGSVIQVVDRAVQPDRRSFPKRTILVLAVTFVWLVLAVSLVLLQAATDVPEERQRLQALKSTWWPANWKMPTR